MTKAICLPRFWSRAACGFVWLLLVAARSASADLGAGQAAFKKGDYARAISEWQRAAEQGDVAAEIALGRLFEFGAPDLRQNYKLADYWYRKAAAQNSVEAEYRLALIWSAGTREFPPDLVEADRWVQRAAVGKGVQGRLAEGLKTQIEEAMSPQQRAALKQGAGSASAGSPAGGTVAALRPPPAEPAPQAPTALDRLNDALAQFDCAALRARREGAGAPIVAGIVPDEGQRARLVQIAEQSFPDSRPRIEVEIVPPPICRSLAELGSLRRVGLFADTPLSVKLASGSAELHEGEAIKVSVAAAGYPAQLRVDYFSLDGNVLHLWPTAAEPQVRLDASGERVLWDAGGGHTWDAGGAPFGTEAITAIATPAPLALGARAPVEPAADYLRDLKNALLRVPVGTGTPNTLATFLVKTGPRRPPG